MQATRTPVFIANSIDWQDVPGSLIDQLTDAGGPGRHRWESIMWQFREVGLLGSVRFQVVASLDGTIWYDMVGNLSNPTEDQENPPDLGPGDVDTLTFTNVNGDHLLAFRFFKVQALSPLGNPTRYGQLVVDIFAR